MGSYQIAYAGWRAKLGAHDPDLLIERSGARGLGAGRIGVRCSGVDYVVSHPDGEVLKADGTPAEPPVAILLLLYLLESTGRPYEDRWISFEQLPGGPGYLASFRGRVVAPILRAFGAAPERLVEASGGMEGEPLKLGDVAVRIPALPRVPIVYTMWRGDEEFAPTANVVFDASVEGYLDAEVLTVLAEVTSRRLVSAVDPRRKEG